MFLDERSFENEGLSFVVSDDELNVGDLLDQFFGLDPITEITAPARLEIRTHAIAQVLRLADIDDFPAGVLVQVHAGCARNFLEFFVESHGNLSSKRHSLVTN